MIPSPPQAPLKCMTYGFPGDVKIRSVITDGTVVTMEFSGEGQSVDTTATGTDSIGHSRTFHLTGSLAGRHIDLLADSGGEVTHYVGDVGDDAKGHGTYTISLGTAPPAFWSTVFPLTCTEFEPQPKPEEPKPAPPNHMFTLTGDVDMYKHPGGKDEDKLPGSWRAALAARR